MLQAAVLHRRQLFAGLLAFKVFRSPLHRRGHFPNLGRLLVLAPHLHPHSLQYSPWQSWSGHPRLLPTYLL